MKIIKTFIIISLFSVSGLNAQIITPIENTEEQAQTQQFEQLIIGNWNPEGESSVLYSYSLNNLVVKINNQIYKTYYWAIYSSTTQSGLVHSFLIIQNTQDANDRRKYEIDALTNERLVLVGNNGIGLQRNLYFRQ